MLVLFDHGTPRTLAVTPSAEAAGFDVLVTTDQNLSYQQNLKNRRIALVVLGKCQWSLIRSYIPEIVRAVDAATPGGFAKVEIQYR